MLRDLDASPSQGTLIVTGYAMFFGGLLMTGARIGDRYGHRRVIVASCGVFAVASLLGAVAQGVPLLAASRCLQGAAAAAAVPAALRLLTTLTVGGRGPSPSARRVERRRRGGRCQRLRRGRRDDPGHELAGDLLAVHALAVALVLAVLRVVPVDVPQREPAVAEPCRVGAADRRGDGTGAGRHAGGRAGAPRNRDGAGRWLPGWPPWPMSPSNGAVSTRWCRGPPSARPPCGTAPSAPSSTPRRPAQPPPWSCWSCRTDWVCRRWRRQPC